MSKDDEPFDGAEFPDSMQIMVSADARIRIVIDGPGYKASWWEPLQRPEEDDSA